MQAIILAAGKGTRMNLDIPKCAVLLKGKPMINYLIDTLTKLGIEIYVVVGYKKEQIKEVIKNKVNFIEQEKQLGTGDAVKSCKNLMASLLGDTLIISGDTPLLSGETIKRLISEQKKKNNDMTILATIKDNPTGYGRIIQNGMLIIKEEKDATIIEKNIKKVNTGIYIINNQILFKNIDRLTNNNSQKEYYLTDLVEILNVNCQVGILTIPDSYELTGINDLKTLQNVEREMRNE